MKWEWSQSKKSIKKKGRKNKNKKAEKKRLLKMKCELKSRILKLEKVKRAKKGQ